MAFCLLPLIVGCQGCRREHPEPPGSTAVPLNEFTFLPGKALPAGDQPLQTAIKPGHWFTASQNLRSNLADQRGTLWQQLAMPQPAPGGASTDDDPAQASPAALRSIAVPLSSQRPAILPRGSSRRLDAQLLAGLPTGGSSRNAWLSSRFQSSITGVALETGDTPLTLMAPHEYLFVVLTNRPNRFAGWQTADWARQLRFDEETPAPADFFYRLILPPADGLLMLPETALHWTSTAVLLWDDLPPEALTDDQARALRDWVHFGGRLLINGTGVDGRAMRGPLADLLPLSIDGQVELDADAARDLLNHWSVPGDSTTTQQISLAAQRTNRVMVDGTLMPSASYLPHTGDLIAGRRVGSGAVVMSRFDLTSDWMTSWRSRDSFFNAVLLGRTPRRVISHSSGWMQTFVTEGNDGATALANGGGLRLLSRDAVVEQTSEDPAAKRAEYAPHPIMGFSGWSDNSDLAQLATRELAIQSGVNIPGRPLVLRWLAIYLIVLVPLNYGVFRLLGRLEWAWAAVPVIGLGGAAWIAHAASLDMGLARSQTEIAIVEMHGGYHRAHATRFIAIYNSLSVRYDFRFATPDAVAAPVGVLHPAGSGETVRPAVLRSGDAAGPVLAGVEVASNRTRPFHAEQFVDAGGAISLQADQLVNDSRFDLKSVQIVRHDEDGNLRYALLDDSPALSRQTVRWQDDPPADSDRPLDDTSAGRLLPPLTDSATIPPGAIRLVAHSETLPPDLTIEPAAPQGAGTTVVVVHLRRPPLATPARGDESLPPTRQEHEDALRKRENP